MGASMAAILTRMVRTAMLEELGQDYIRTARAKGLSESAVVWRHALPNAMVPIVTVVGLQFGALLAFTTFGIVFAILIGPQFVEIGELSLVRACKRLISSLVLNTGYNVGNSDNPNPQLAIFLSFVAWGMHSVSCRVVCCLNHC